MTTTPIDEDFEIDPNAGFGDGTKLHAIQFLKGYPAFPVDGGARLTGDKITGFGLKTTDEELNASVERAIAKRAKWRRMSISFRENTEEMWVREGIELLVIASPEILDMYDNRLRSWADQCVRHDQFIPPTQGIAQGWAPKRDKKTKEIEWKNRSAGLFETSTFHRSLVLVRGLDWGQPLTFSHYATMTDYMVTALQAMKEMQRNVLASEPAKARMKELHKECAAANHELGTWRNLSDDDQVAAIKAYMRAYPLYNTGLVLVNGGRKTFDQGGGMNFFSHFTPEGGYTDEYLAPRVATVDERMACEAYLEDAIIWSQQATATGLRLQPEERAEVLQARKSLETVAA